MNTRSSQIAAMILVAFVSVVHQSTCRAQGAYQISKEIPVDGSGECRAMALDESTRRLYLACAKAIVVVDIDKQQIVGQMTNLPGTRSFTIAPKLHRGFSVTEEEGIVKVFDLKSLKLFHPFKTQTKLVSWLFDPSPMAELYTFHAGDTNSALFYEADDGDLMGSIALPGKPGATVSAPKLNRVYCYLQDKNEIAVIDTKTHKVSNTWPVAPGESVSAMTFDPIHQCLFLACANKQLVVMDGTSGKVLTTAPIGEGAAGLAFDAAAQQLFCFNVAGSLALFHEGSPDKLQAIQVLETQRVSTAMVFDPKAHCAYLATTSADAAGNFKVVVCCPGSLSTH